MKLQLTTNGKSLLESIKILKSIGYEDEYQFLDLFIFGLEELIQELKETSFDNMEHLEEYGQHIGILLDCVIKASYIISVGTKKGLIELI